ncbi:hypothetical protein QTG54_009113 [Skeletonema marinoi]|uniref:Transmembrane protein n=1 Tax=Skeletonema marinoi TaxID=267567 RepID=A0AAD8Y6N2_9STRA|nr:hypothetical protein QTG54_009113 [Skeletonema marinoi]
MTTRSTLPNKKGINSTVIAASILVTAGSVLICYFQYDIWTGRCEHLTDECEGCSRLEIEYKPSTCESSAACSWAAAAYLGVGVMMLWIEKHRMSTMRAYDVDRAAERKAMKISLPPVNIPFSREDETPQGDKLQVV